MKESKVKGKCWLPAYIVRNTSVRQNFRAEKIKRRRGHLEHSISAEEQFKEMHKIA